jgi:hypothetical protein
MKRFLINAYGFIFGLLLFAVCFSIALGDALPPKQPGEHQVPIIKREVTGSEARGFGLVYDNQNKYDRVVDLGGPYADIDTCNAAVKAIITRLEPTVVIGFCIPVPTIRDEPIT